MRRYYFPPNLGPDFTGAPRGRVPVKAYSIPEKMYPKGRFVPQWTVPDCPFCGQWHVHGAAPGSRVPHCHYPHGDYTLEYAGPLPRELWDTFKNRHKKRRTPK